MKFKKCSSFIFLMPLHSASEMSLISEPPHGPWEKRNSSFRGLDLIYISLRLCQCIAVNQLSRGFPTSTLRFEDRDIGPGLSQSVLQMANKLHISVSPI